MSKNIFKIDSINVSIEINIGTEQGVSSMDLPFDPAIIGAMIHSAFASQGTGEAGTAPTEGQAADLTPSVDPVVATAAAPAEGMAVPTLNAENVLAFLASNPKFKFRSTTAIGKHFGRWFEDETEAVDDVLGGLEADDKIVSKYSFKRGEALYSLAPAGTVTADQVWAFLSSDQKFKHRTAKAVAKQFNVSEDAAGEVLGTLVAAGEAKRKWSSRKGVDLYSPLARREVPAPVAPAAEPDADAVEGPGISDVKVLAFLREDERFGKRTAKAIAKNFGVAQGDSTLADILADMVEACQLKHERRRRDGVSLYSAA